MNTKSKIVIPRLPDSPFAPAEVVDVENLSADDRLFLKKREQIIEVHRKTFLEVGNALIDIRDHRGGLLYKRYGTFDAYCKERWDRGHSHAYRLMDAAEIYGSLSPRGDKSPEVILPETEKQLRPLKKLPPKLRLKAWQNAVKVAGPAPVAARHVEREVRNLFREEGLTPAAKPQKRAGSSIAWPRTTWRRSERCLQKFGSPSPAVRQSEFLTGWTRSPPCFPALDAVPSRIQLRRAKGWRKPADTVSVARRTRFGNPFSVAEHAV